MGILIKKNITNKIESNSIIILYNKDKIVADVIINKSNINDLDEIYKKINYIISTLKYNTENNIDLCKKILLEKYNIKIGD